MKWLRLILQHTICKARLVRPFGVWCTRKEVKDGGSSMTASLSFFIGEKMKKYPYNIERAVNGLSMKLCTPHSRYFSDELGAQN